MCAAPRGAGAVLGAEVTETSGLAASAIHADVIYLHNDSGDSPRFFAMTRSGGDLGAFDLAGAEAVDWEDMARGPCAPGAAASSCLYLADFGDNRRKRGACALYRVPEPPQVGAGRPAGPIAAEVLPFEYPDGSHDAEALLVHPVTGEISIVTKVHSGASRIFTFPAPLAPGRRVTLLPAGEIAPPQGSPRYTGGDVHPQGKGVLMRTYTHVFFHPMREGQTVAQALAGAPCALPVAEEEQGESIAWLRSGDAYVTVSEGRGAPIQLVSCAWP
ncbi:MAG: hypothetical protein IT372_28670 [Polyangiaceae bacterium]|nr:hypothetical protein [Polyangiaceae bacterium]